MKWNEVLTITSQLHALSELLKPENGDARWGALQEWLDKNPEWKSEVDYYVTVSGEEALEDLREYICSRAGITKTFLATVIPAPMEAQARASIEIIQQLYRERQGADKPKLKTKKKRKEIAK